MNKKKNTMEPRKRHKTMKTKIALKGKAKAGPAHAAAQKSRGRLPKPVICFAISCMANVHFVDTGRASSSALKMLSFPFMMHRWSLAMMKMEAARMTQCQTTVPGIALPCKHPARLQCHRAAGNPPPPPEEAPPQYTPRRRARLQTTARSPSKSTKSFSQMCFRVS